MKNPKEALNAYQKRERSINESLKHYGDPAAEGERAGREENRMRAAQEKAMKGIHNFTIVPTNEGQDLNYSRPVKDTFEQARGLAVEMAVKLEKALPGASIGYRIEDANGQTIENVNW